MAPTVADAEHAVPGLETKGIGEHFDEWAPRYDAQIREMVPRYEEIHDTLISLLTLRPPERVLDLGAGTGYTLQRVLSAFPAATAVGLDVSHEMLRRAAQRVATHDARVELRESDIAEPEIAGRYDAIISILAVHHLYPDEKRHLFSRIWEHIEPGGLFLLADYFRPAEDRLSEIYHLPDERTSTRPSTTTRTPRPSTSAGCRRRASPPWTWSGSTTTWGCSSPSAPSARAAPRPTPRGRAAPACARARRRSHPALRRRRRPGGRG